LRSASQLGHLPKWQREKALALHEICQEVRRGIKGGATKAQAFHDACMANAGRLLSTSNGKTKILSLSESSLRRHYQTWLKMGEAVTAFVPDYKPGKAKIPGELIVEFQRLCTLPGTATISVALGELKKLWRAGEQVPGLGTWQFWWQKNRPAFPMPEHAPDFPVSDRTLYHHKPSQAALTWGRKGKAAALKELPWITRDYSKLRPGEVYTFDDVRLDILAIDDSTKKPTELQAYIAYEVGSRLIPSFVMRPANAMLKSDVDELVVDTLQKCGIGRTYPTHLIFEHGTLTMSEAGKELIERVSEGRIVVHYTQMNSAKTYVGAYQDAGSGHWMGKGVIESLMRKIHLALMTLPGQRGNHYTNQPASLGWIGQGQLPKPGTFAREAAMLAEIEMWSNRRVKLNLGLLWAQQVGLILRKAIDLHNNDRGHKYQGFGTITQKESAPGVWEDVICSS